MDDLFLTRELVSSHPREEKMMRKYLLHLCLILSSVLLMDNAAAAKQEWINVKWVSDGDSIVLGDGRHVRYIGINAPEIAHDNHKAEIFGYEAKKYNQSLVRSKKVRLEFDKEKYDRYGRLLAYIFLSDGTFINKKMIEKGYAYVMPRSPNTKYDRMLLKTQRDAMSAKQGMWRNWDEKEDEEYFGSKRSKRFHLNTCPYGRRIKKRNRIYFTRKWDAFWSGFAPCKRCMSGGN
jgi:micrococcal nuclease